MAIDIDVSVDAGDCADEAALAEMAAQCVDAAIARLGLGDPMSELSILFTDNKAMQALNAQWRGKDKPTNVLSFPAFDLSPGDPPGPMLGDIVIAHETLRDEAALEAKPFDDHLRHLIVHGFLHVLGYDHENDADAEEMEAAERAILADIGVPDPYSEAD